VKDEMTFKEYLELIKQKTLSAYDNQDYQFEDLVDKVGARRDLNRNPLFDVMFVLQNMEVGSLEVEDLDFKPYGSKDSVVQFDITLIAEEVDNEIHFTLNYQAMLFNNQTIDTLSEYYKFIIKSTLENLDMKICAIDLITEEQNENILKNSKYNNLYKEEEYEFDF
ncbi:condensation domain-containing protein, partial [Viridibacillus arvi]|uniref:condensation domain-containing protein n=10 Tax=Viridibacillus TaxID=496496 RepID=UPI0037F8CDDC